MNTEKEIYKILRKHRLGLNKREEIIVDLLDFINKRDKQLSIHSVVKSFYCQTGRCNKTKNKQCDECGLLELNNMQ